MKKILIFLILFGAMKVVAQDSLSTNAPLHSASDSLDYYFGVNMGYSLENNPYINNRDLVLEGFIHAIQGEAKDGLNASREILMALLSEQSEKSKSPQGAAAIENLNKGKAFLSDNSKRDGVVTTSSGLQYEIISQGTGPLPTSSSTVEVHYEGTLLDGTQFDSSYDRGESISFPLNRVIKGWTEGVQLMKVGSIYKFFIPSELAYKSQTKGSIPANSVLIFKIELLEIR